MEEMEKYFTMSKASDDEKCQATLLMTNGAVGSFIQGVIRGKNTYSRNITE